MSQELGGMCWHLTIQIRILSRKGVCRAGQAHLERHAFRQPRYSALAFIHFVLVMENSRQRIKRLREGLVNKTKDLVVQRWYARFPPTYLQNVLFVGSLEAQQILKIAKRQYADFFMEIRALQVFLKLGPSRA